MKAKRLFISVIALCCTMVAWAQENDMLTVILQHEGNATLFVGMNAFINAHEAAVDGDVITLSAGKFNLTSITKKVSIYGAGYEEDATTGTGVTSLLKWNGYDMMIGKTGEVLKNVHLEGLRIESNLNVATSTAGQTNPVENLTVSKCYIAGNISFCNSITDVAVSQCVTTGGIYGGADYLATNLTICNCYIGTLVSTFKTESSVLIDHCIIGEGFYHDSGCAESAFTWQNCIFLLDSWYHHNVGFGSYAYNNLFPNFERNIPASANCENNYELESGVSIFTDATDGKYSAGRSFTISNPTLWLGNDDTEVGINGGLGFSRVPATPVVKNLSAAVDGKKLIVDFQTNVRPVPTTNPDPESEP